MPRQKEGTHIKEKNKPSLVQKCLLWLPLWAAKYLGITYLSNCCTWSFGKELDLLWGWLGKLKGRNEIIKQRHCLLDRVITGGSPVSPEKYCHLIVGRLILKLHSCPGGISQGHGWGLCIFFFPSCEKWHRFNSRLKFRVNSGSKDLRVARAALKSQLHKPEAKQKNEERVWGVFFVLFKFLDNENLVLPCNSPITYGNFSASVISKNS